MLFLALDQSTSATKALLFDREGRVVDKVSREHTQHFPRPGWVEHDAEEIWQNTLIVLKTLLERHREHRKEIRSLSICNQRETTVVFDRASGKPLRRAIVWQCRRSVDICKAHRAAGHEETIQRKTGLLVDAYFSASKLQWLVENEPQIGAALESGQACASTIDAYLVHRLTGGEVFATDHTNASRTLLFDISTRQWDDELCGLFGVPRQSLPEVRECTAHFGETTLGGALEQPIPIVGVMGDSQASLFAQRCYEPGGAKVTFGTGSSILLNIGHEIVPAPKGVVTTLAWVHNGVPTYAFEGIIISSASTLVWLKDQLGLIHDIAECEEMATQLEDNGGVYLVPAFSGLGLPHWAPAAKAAIVGLTSQSDRRHLARAGLESIAYQIRDALDAMCNDDIQVAQLYGDGGPTANRFLMQFVADLVGVELSINTVSECSPLGAVLAGMLGQGEFDSLDAIAASPRYDIRYEPVNNGSATSEAYLGWQAAVQQLLNSPSSS
ncbi:MAG: glycerol kinase GlpK [Verrucomicrobiota bacterium JB022]|nr:glycerol kinase GlpK [Verrucomicrobiota bacterium JB022]